MVEPFLKWAGGKRQLAPEILRRAPTRFGRYHEPFLGGGAVFFALRTAQRADCAMLTDANVDEIVAFLLALHAFLHDGRGLEPLPGRFA